MRYALAIVALLAAAGALGFTLSQDTSTVSTEVRISLRQLDNETVEFALQQREGDGWGERMLLPFRFLPPDPILNQWYDSAPYTVEIEAPAPIDEAATAPPTDGASCLLSDHVERVSAATFRVETDAGSGSAIYLGRDEWITNHHVVGTASQVQLVRGDYTIIANVIGSLPDYDLALLRAPAPFSVHPLSFAASQPTQGSSVHVLGFPSGVSGTPALTSGVISRHAPLSEFEGFAGAGLMVQIDAALNPGNSGGPMVNDCGDVVGVVTHKLFTSTDGRDLEGIGYGISGETVAAQLPALRTTPHQTPSGDSSQTDAEVPAESDERAQYGVELPLTINDEGVGYKHEQSQFGWETWVFTADRTDSSFYDRSTLGILCDHETSDVIVFVSVSRSGSSTARLSSRGVSLGKFVDREEHYRFDVGSDIVSLRGSEAKTFLRRALTQTGVAIVLPTLVSGLVRADFELEILFETPVQHLLERCLD